jgi:hypothetical protein
VAIFNETLAGRFNEMIRRLHQMKSTPAPQVAPEISHSITLENDRPEWLVLHGGFPWAFRASTVAAAGFVSVVGVRNPAGSGLLVVVTEIDIMNTNFVAGNWQLRTKASQTVQSVGTSFFRDSRRGFGGNCPVQIINDNANFATTGAVGNGPLEVVALGAGEGGRLFESPPYILTPGFDLYVNTNAVNLPVDASFSGYARQLTPEELNIL